jgi:hypothetical protein
VDLAAPDEEGPGTWLVLVLAAGALAVGILFLLSVRPSPAKISSRYHPPARHRRDQRASR